MKFMTLAAIHWYAQTLAVIFVLTCIILIVIVLLQKGRGGGLSAAFGGAGGHSAFGSKTGDVFTKITIGIVAVFLILSMVLTKIWVPFEELDEQQGLQSSGQPGGGQPPSTAGQAQDSTKENEGSSTPSESKPGANPADGDSSAANPGSGTSGNSPNPNQSNNPKEGN